MGSNNSVFLYIYHIPKTPEDAIFNIRSSNVFGIEKVCYTAISPFSAKSFKIKAIVLQLRGNANGFEFATNSNPGRVAA